MMDIVATLALATPSLVPRANNTAGMGPKRETETRRQDPPGLALPSEAPKVPEVRGRRGYSTQDSWKIPIEDWHKADPSIGHLVPLKDWKPEWYEGPLGKVDGRGMKYHQRRVIAQEFQLCVHLPFEQSFHTFTHAPANAH